MPYPAIPLEREDNLAIRAFGKRLFEGQALYEYLLEFALIFMSQKRVEGETSPEGSFPCRSGRVTYLVEPRMGLKRFIFFERSKLENRFDVDKDAYREHRELLRARINVCTGSVDQEDVLNVVQELYYGFSAVLMNRSWFVQSLLPLTREVIFPEAMGKKQERKPLDFDFESEDVDSKFEFNEHLFMARGGEVYFLHVLQGLQDNPDLRGPIEVGLRALFSAFPMFSGLSDWIQHSWDEKMNPGALQGPGSRLEEKTCGWIPDGYSSRAPHTCQELATFLNSDLDPLKKMEVLARGIVLQILRMMHEQAAMLVGTETAGPAWILCVPGCTSHNVKVLAIESYQHCEETLTTALYKVMPEGLDTSEQQKRVRDASPNAHRLFRKLGKQIGLVVPPKGSSMRFSLSEDLLRFLVLSLVPPGRKVLFSTLLDDMYKHFRIIVGPKQLAAHSHGPNRVDESWLAPNEMSLQTMLKQAGFLRDLSDATSIVENPFGGIEE